MVSCEVNKNEKFRNLGPSPLSLSLSHLLRLTKQDKELYYIIKGGGN
jgi:hypothetical protein